MSKNTVNVPRWHYLSLNIKDLKRCKPETKLQVTKDNISTPATNHSAVIPWISVLKPFQMARNKIGVDLLRRCRNGFHLDDPYMHQSRFFTEYHRLHDPGLKRYYNRIPVRNRLKKLELINNENDAICTNKEMIDYLRYLDEIRSKNMAKSMNKQESIRLSNHFSKLNELKKKEPQFAGIFRRTKHKREPKTSANLNEQRMVKLKKHLDQKQNAIQRSVKAKAVLHGQIKHKNEIRALKTIAKKKTISEKHSKRRTEIKEILEKRLSEANKRRETLQKEKRLSKMKKNLDFFEKCLELGEKNYYRTIELFEEYNRNRNECIRKRQNMVERTHELNQNGMVKIRQQISLRKFKNEECKEIVDKIMQLIPGKIEKFKRKIDPENMEEVLRRFSMLTPRFVKKCAETVYGIYRRLEIPSSASIVIFEIINCMIKRVSIIPTMDEIKCVLVQQRLAEIIMRFVHEIKDEHVNRMMKELKNEKQLCGTPGILSGTHGNDPSSSSPESAKVHVCFIEPTDIVEEKETDEFKMKKAAMAKKIDKMYSLDNAIRREVNEFFEEIVTNEFDIPDEYNTRDWVSLYNFQKYFICSTVERIIDLVEVKQEHDWMIYEQSTWKGQKFDVESIMLRTAKMVMSYSRSVNEICECVCAISKYICVQIDTEFEIEKQKFLSEINQTENDGKSSQESYSSTKE